MLYLRRRDHAYLLELCSNLRRHVSLGRIFSQLVQDFQGFLVAILLDQPARRFWEEPDCEGEDQDRDGIEGNGKSPPEAPLPAIHVADAERYPVRYGDTDVVGQEKETD